MGYRSQNEMDELRNGEKTHNANSLADAKAGLEAVEQAQSILKAFYDQGAVPVVLATVRTSYDPAGGDRNGRTVADAPETFDETQQYTGRQEESKGILGLLSVIESDFQRTID